jgi:hypothetical protein
MVNRLHLTCPFTWSTRYDALIMIMMMHRTENDKCQDLYTAENATEQYAVTQLRNTLTIEGDVY